MLLAANETAAASRVANTALLRLAARAEHLRAPALPPPLPLLHLYSSALARTRVEYGMPRHLPPPLSVRPTRFQRSSNAPQAYKSGSVEPRSTSSFMRGTYYVLYRFAEINSTRPVTGIAVFATIELTDAPEPIEWVFSISVDLYTLSRLLPLIHLRAQNTETQTKTLLPPQSLILLQNPELKPPEHNSSTTIYATEYPVTGDTENLKFVAAIEGD
ncbi:hypothetical protein B0H17DRAFT_1145525 [Mycena rosella]|uniref:Uncharacterized protein n=1 Tax=Mycena rosella TaxID=1033263 RepID=A0AAD7CQT1_MYCRO|nr:hypothetical protein B0H17DRAFT_1145525 [Mycena rosella]